MSGQDGGGAGASGDDKMDRFELAAAFLLGIGAVGSALCAFQDGLWGGNMSTAYGEAATLMTRAATDYNEMIAEVNHDYDVDMLAKKTTMEAMATKDEDRREILFGVASTIYTSYMGQKAYEKVGLPMDKYHEGEGDDLPEELLIKALDHELGPDYVKAQMKESIDDLDSADDRFDDGRKANDIGDMFGLASVFYAIGMFFAGIASTFRSRARWVLLILGAVIILGATAYGLTLPRA